MNKKGFTLIELLAVMVIISIISLIAVPNVMGIMDNNKKSKIISDGMNVIALAKYKIAKDKDFRNSINAEGINLKLVELDDKNDLTADPDGFNYNRDTSYVKINKENDIINYCIYLESNKWKIGNNNICITEDILAGNNAKDFVNKAED